MAKGKKVKLRELKGSGYKCPVCKKGNLVAIKTEKHLGNVEIRFKTIDGISFQFSCDIKNDNFFLCNNKKCRARLEKSDWQKGEKTPGPPCEIINCKGSLDTYKNVPVAKIFPKEGSKNVILTYGGTKKQYFEVVTGQLSYDQAGICTECRYVGPKEIDLR